MAEYFGKEGRPEVSSRTKALIPLISYYYKRGEEEG
jgi:hypothetical protein